MLVEPGLFYIARKAVNKTRYCMLLSVEPHRVPHSIIKTQTHGKTQEEKESYIHIIFISLSHPYVIKCYILNTIKLKILSLKVYLSQCTVS